MNYIIFDLEATCWDRTESWVERDQNETIEIGAVKLDADYKEVGQFQLFVRPFKHGTLSEFCKTLTTIQQSDVDGAPFFVEAFPKFIEWAGSDALFCSWGFYDIEQLKRDCAFNKMELPKMLHCSLKHNHQAMLKLPKGLGVGRALKNAKMVFEGVKHRGIDDSKNIVKLFRKYAPEIHQNNKEHGV